MSKMNPIVHLDETVFQQIMYWCRKAGNFEVSGLGNVVYDPKTNVFTVNKVYLLEQENTGVTSDINQEALGKLMFQHHKAKQKGEVDGELRFWWHSHANMNVFWSGTDIATIKQLSNEGWFLSTVFNNKEEMRSAFHMTEPMTVFTDELETTVMQSFGDKEIEKHLAKMGLQVRPGKLGEFRWIVEPFLSDKVQLSWDEEYDTKVKVKKWEPSVKHASRMPHSMNHFSDINHFNPLVPKAFDKEEDDASLSQRFREMADIPPGVDEFPGFAPKGKFSLSDDEMFALMDEVEEFIIDNPGSSRVEVIEAFEGDYPFIAEIIHPNFKGLASES